MSQGLEWIDAGNRLELRNEQGKVVASEITHDGRSVHFDLSKEKKTLQNVVRQWVGLRPIRQPKVVFATYRFSEVGKAREKAARDIEELQQQHLDAVSCQTLKRQIVGGFRKYYPRQKTRD